MTAALRLAAAWTTVLIFVPGGTAMMAGTHPVATGLLFAWLLFVNRKAQKVKQFNIVVD